MNRVDGRLSFLVMLAALLLPAGSLVYALTNTGSSASPAFDGNHISPDLGGPRLLYAPSQGDDAGYRAAMAAQVDGTCDYFDARVATPPIALLHSYDCVMTWADYPYFNNVAFGNSLADFVDGGGRAVLGAFCAYTSGNYLSGRIMTETSRYCPVTGGFNHFSLAMWDGSDPATCVHVRIGSYGSTFRDYLTLISGSVYGRFTDGEIANAVNTPYNDVVYANGAAGFPAGPVGQDAGRVANACFCAGPGATESGTWGSIKAMYR